MAGASQDLEIFHNGTNSVINDAGTGDLVFQSGGSEKARFTSTGFTLQGAYSATGNFNTSLGGYQINGTTVIDSSRNLTNIGSYAGSGSVLLGNTSANFSELTAVGSLELCRTDANGFIDFKSALSEDYDCRIQQSSNGLIFQTGGNGSTATALTLNSSRNATFAGDIDLADDKKIKLGASDDLQS